MKTKVIAMNQVHKFIKAVQPDMFALFENRDDSIYKQDGTLTKRFRDCIRFIIKTHNVDNVRVSIRDQHNSVYLFVDQQYKLDVGCGYYEAHLYIVTKKQDNLYNVPCTFDSDNYKTNWTVTKLRNYKKRVGLLDERIRELTAKKRLLEYWL